MYRAKELAIVSVGAFLISAAEFVAYVLAVLVALSLYGQYVGFQACGPGIPL